MSGQTRDETVRRLYLLDEGLTPAVEGEVTYDGSSFQMKDATGTFDPRTGGSPPATDRAWRRHFMLMGA